MRFRSVEQHAALDRLVDAVVCVAAAGAMPTWRCADILEHVDQVDWLAQRGIGAGPMRWPSAPRPVPPAWPGYSRSELAAIERRTAAGLWELVRKGLPS